MDLLRSNNYICHFLVVRTELARKVGGFRPEYDGSQDYDFIFRVVENIPVSAVAHIDRVLYHWRSHSRSTAVNPESKTYAYEAGKRAIEEHLKRKGIPSTVLETPHRGFYRVKYLNPDVSIKTLSRNEWNNITEDELKGISEELIMVLSDDLSPISEDYLEELSGAFCRYEVGCVGGKIFDKGGRLESAGFCRNDEGELVPEFAGLNSHFSGYLHRASLLRKVDAVSLDCMMIRRSAIEYKDNKPSMASGYITLFDPYATFRRI